MKESNEFVTSTIVMALYPIVIVLHETFPDEKIYQNKKANYGMLSIFARYAKG